MSRGVLYLVLCHSHEGTDVCWCVISFLALCTVMSCIMFYIMNSWLYKWMKYSQMNTLWPLAGSFAAICTELQYCHTSLIHIEQLTFGVVKGVLKNATKDFIRPATMQKMADEACKFHKNLWSHSHDLWPHSDGLWRHFDGFWRHFGTIRRRHKLADDVIKCQ